MAHLLPPEQARVVQALEPGIEVEVGSLAERLGLDQSQVAGAAVLLEQEGWLTVRTEEFEEWSLDPAAFPEAIAANPVPYFAGFESPRTKILRALLDHGGQGSIPEVSQWTGLDPKEVGQAIKPLSASGWATKKGGTLETSLAALPKDLFEERLRTLSAIAPASDIPQNFAAGLFRSLFASTPASGGASPGGDVGPVHAEEDLVIRALATGPRTVQDLRGAGVPGAWIDTARELAPQALPKGAFVSRKRRRRHLQLTTDGAARRQTGVEAVREASQLTPELLASGEWRNVRFKPYDINLATEPLHAGKRHPLQRVIERTRQAFLEMGFEEAASPYVESGFWDFDALFQPQDHPAREMQDTFYVREPGRSPLPADAELVRRVRETHENGGDTGSVGWRYRWDPEKAIQNVLRTHTTATTIRELAKNPKGPRKVFSIGRVYRRETIDYKHLPIFFQVDGIIVDENASLSTLLGTLAAFYERMGFERFYFRPGFFPYTEPSVEVFIWHEEKQDWFEMGGSGIFRPEVTEPLGCTQPVLAWGLGLDRLAMLLYDRSDIRDLYLADLDWLRAEPRCR